LHNKDVVLTPGEYILMIDPIWNAVASTDKLYKKVLVDIYSKNLIEIEPVDDNTGMKALVLMLKNFAYNMKADARKYYLNSDPEYAKVFRILDIKSTGCYYGFFYTRNDSAFTLSEIFTPKLAGATVVWPISNTEVELNLKPGEDHIIIFRRTEDTVSVGFSSRIQPRRINPDGGRARRQIGF
jgi:hypothetical protein